MELKFFGRGSGFSDISEGNNSAYFEKGSELFVIDCPMSTFYKVKKMDLSKYDRANIFITHTHSDHISGLGLMVQYSFFVLGVSIFIIAPSMSVKADIQTFLKIVGCLDNWYNIVDLESENIEWVNSISTKHTSELQNKCFGFVFNINNKTIGFVFNINNKTIVYTGDTCRLNDFAPYIVTNSELYVDVSVYYGQVHLKLEDVLCDLKDLVAQGIKVYLMHLDDVSAAQEMVKDIEGVEVVEIFD